MVITLWVAMVVEVIIDELGMSDPDLVCRIMGVDGERIKDDDSRLNYLALASKGLVGTVITGPLGANFWLRASNSVDIRICPDGSLLKERETSSFKWACHQDSNGKALLARKSPPTRGRLLEPWQRAVKLASTLDQLIDIIPTPKTKAIIDDFSCLEVDDYVSMDWEWNIHTKHPIGYAQSSATSDWYVPVRAQGQVFRTAHESRRKWSSALRRGMPCVFHNGRADLGTQYDSDPIELFGKPIDDTLLMAFLVNPDADDLGLKTLTAKYLGRRAIPYPGDVEALTIDLAADYAACSDTRNTYDLRRILTDKLIETNQWNLYRDVERPLVPVVASMEKYGVPVDIKKVIAKYKEHVTLESSFISLYKSQGYNVRHSRKGDSRLRTYVTDILGFDPGDMDQRTLSGYPHGEIDLVLYFTRLRTRRNNFLKSIVKTWAEQGFPDEVRVYPQYNQAGKQGDAATFGRAPRTGRFSSSGPNFQQQPRDLRDIYIPPKGYKWWKYDYSQLELRLAANLSGDKNLVSDLLSGDPHGQFRQYIKDITGIDPGRPTSKTANFEKLYFGGDGQLVRVLQKERVFIGRELAREIGRAHSSRYSRYYDYARDVVGNARANNGQVRTVYGRLRTNKEVYSPDTAVSQHGERALINHTIQGYAADIVKKVMAMLVPILNSYGAHMAITVHDELDGWVPDSVDLVAFDRDVRECMQSLNVGPVPLLVDGGIRESWAG